MELRDALRKNDLEYIKDYYRTHGGDELLAEIMVRSGKGIYTENGYTESPVLKYLTTFPEPGFNPNFQDSKGVTALYRAAYYHNYANIKYLLKIGADPNIKSYGMIPLHILCKSLSPVLKPRRCARLLLDSGADPNIIDHNGENVFSALHVGYNEDLKMARLLIRKGARYDRSRIDGLKPVILFFRSKKFRLVKLVYKLSKNIDLKISQEIFPKNPELILPYLSIDTVMQLINLTHRSLDIKLLVDFIMIVG